MVLRTGWVKEAMALSIKGSFIADFLWQMLDKSSANGQELINEAATIGRIHHVNAVIITVFFHQGIKACPFIRVYAEWITG
jgi:hypothetical protein